MTRQIGILALALILTLSSVAQALPCHHGDDPTMPSMNGKPHNSSPAIGGGHHSHHHHNVVDQGAEAEPAVPEDRRDHDHDHDCVCPAMLCCSAAIHVSGARLAPELTEQGKLTIAAPKRPFSNTVTPEDRPPQRS